MPRLAFLLIALVAVIGGGWFVAGRSAGSSDPPAVTDSPTSTPESLALVVERAMCEERDKPRFVGTLGDFRVAPRGDPPPEARIFSCASTQVSDREVMRGHELWAAPFEPGGLGWACPDGQIILVNNEGDYRKSTHDALLARGYFSSLPLVLMRDAPRDRLEIISVEGHPALLERPIPGYPYGVANLAVIERYPTADSPGIMVAIEMAPSVDAAIELAASVMP